MKKTIEFSPIKFHIFKKNCTIEFNKTPLNFVLSVCLTSISVRRQNAIVPEIGIPSLFPAITLEVDAHPPMKVARVLLDNRPPGLFLSQILQFASRAPHRPRERLWWQ